MTVAFVFPGQGSQSIGMQAGLAADYPVVEETYRTASGVLGFDLWGLVQQGPAEHLDETTNTQPAMLAAGVAAWRAWCGAGGAAPAFMAGHSLGEYSALVAAGALEFADAVALVRRRAELMQAAVPAGEGAMAAILGLDDAAVLEACASASVAGVAEAVNFNAPGQVVVAGERAALEHMMGLAREAGARRALMLPVSVPAHSSLMRSAGDELAASIDATAFREPEVAVVCAVDGSRYRNASDIRSRLKQQVYSPVRWVDTVQTMTGNGVSGFVECGPGKVLAGLVRRIDRSVAVSTLDSAEALRNALEGVTK